MKRKKPQKLNLNWRDTWYSVILWILAIIIGGFVVLPWYYIALPLVVFWTTIIYFHKSDKSLRMGLWCALFWFFVICTLDLLEILGPYYKNASFYFSDSRNWLKFPLILLIPIIYTLISESRSIKKVARRKLRLANIEKLNIEPI